MAKNRQQIVHPLSSSLYKLQTQSSCTRHYAYYGTHYREMNPALLLTKRHLVTWVRFLEPLQKRAKSYRSSDWRTNNSTTASRVCVYARYRYSIRNKGATQHSGDNPTDEKPPQ